MKMKLLQTTLIALLGAAATISLEDKAVSGAGVRMIAATGQAAPGMIPGATFSTFNDPPAISDTGRVAFVARVTHPEVEIPASGIWASTEGSNRLVAVAGQLPVVSSAGHTAYYGFSPLGTGIWVEKDGSANSMYINGNPAPGTDGATFNALNNGLVLMNEKGDVAFKAALVGDSVVDSNREGIWLTSSGVLSLVARRGDPAPGTPPGNLHLALSEPVLNDAGAVAFASATSGGLFGIWSGIPGDVQLLVDSNDDATGIGGGIKFDSFNGPSINAAGQIAFASSVKGNGISESNNRGIWVLSNNQLELVARKGNVAPQTTSEVVFNTPTPPLINAAGDVAFRTALSGLGVNTTNDQAIYTWKAGVLDLTVREGSSAPGTEPGVQFQNLSIPNFNAAGQVAFAARLANTSGAKDAGIWATDLGGEVQLIAREGDMLEVAPNDFRTISVLMFPNIATAGNDDGRQSGFNNKGQLAFTAYFTDGSSGVFVSDLVAVPEPNTCVLLASILCGILPRSCRSGARR
jgi:hypothetical protein